MRAAFLAGTFLAGAGLAAFSVFSAIAAFTGFSGFRKQMELNARTLKVGQDKVDKDDILAGLTAAVTFRLAEPQFEGQTKEVLGTAAVRANASPRSRVTWAVSRPANRVNAGK